MLFYCAFLLPLISIYLKHQSIYTNMKRLTILYAVFVIFCGIFAYNIQVCTARPDDTQTQIFIQKDIDVIIKTDETNSVRSEAVNEKVSQETNIKKCGVPNKLGLNKDGLEFLSSGQTKAGEFPWTVAILRKLNRNPNQQTLLYSGAGSLIHPSVVLTAANKHHKTAMDIVRAGEWDFGNIDEKYPYQDRAITHIQSIDEKDPDSVQLIFVSQPFVLTTNVRTVCLPLPGTSIESTVNRDCTTAAWGQQNCSGIKGLHSIMGRAELSTQSQQSTCEVDWQQYLEDIDFRLKGNQFCTKRKHSIDDSCFCDHGAALFCPIQFSGKDNIQYEQIGVSIASGGCTRDLPGIFSSVIEQRAAIHKIFAEKGLDSSYYTA